MARRWLWTLLPLLLLATLIAAFLSTRPFDFLGAGAPPVEKLTIERTRLGEAGISVWVRAGGSETVKIAQIQVDGAYWTLAQVPEGPIARLASARIDIPYPWVEGETHHLKFVTSTGATFSHTIDVAIQTPQMTGADLLAYAAVGIFVGIVPVALGMLFYPALKGSSATGLGFVLALTIGLLVFLFIDTLEEGLEVAEKAAAGFQASALVWLAALLTFLGLMAIGRRGGRRPEGTALAYFIALGIGLHNLGEGLAIGASFAAGEAALASYLILGFTLHNVTEGIGIAAPMTRERPPLLRFAALAAIAGLPAVIGTWGGAFSYSPHWTAVSFGIGAGAILQVIVEVTSYLGRSVEGRTGWFSGANLAGFAVGLGVMYVTALLVPD